MQLGIIALQILSVHILENTFARRLMINRAGQRRRRHIVFRLAQRSIKSAVAAHGQTCNEVVLTLGGKGENGTHDHGQFFCIKLEIILAISRVRVEGVSGGGHDHRQLFGLCVPLNVGITQPVGVIGKGSMQQI